MQHREHRAAQTKVAAVDASAIHTRCMSSNARATRAVQDSCASARIRLITPERSAGPVVGRRGRRREPQRVADVLELAQVARARRAIVQVGLDRDELADRQLAIVKGLETPPHRRAGQERHTSLNCARSASRARASRDLTVPTAMPSEKPISS